ncbi:MAG: DUF861 domain-containing protein [Anaerolineae bacterium]|nr:DUF861 domain-containing protein [Anaerolineae bacterium]
MRKRFLTADMIRARRAEGHNHINLEPGDVLTPLAADTAREMGIEIRPVNLLEAPIPQATSPTNGSIPAKEKETSSLPTQVAPPDLEPLIRQVVMACLSSLNGNGPATAASVKRVGAQSYQMKPFPFEINRPEMDVQLVDVITAENGSPMAAGFLSFHKGSFPWTLTYDEIEFVLEGEIHIGTAQGTVVGKPGDVHYIPKGTQITFGTPGWAKILYVTYPAEWSG